ncbi:MULTISPECIES: DUF3237 domain-containing protein [unclassified Blastococcus]
MGTLVPEFEYTVDVGTAHEVGAGPLGHRICITVDGGELAGDRLKGRFVGAAADWILIGSDGYGRLDVRATLETVDGAYVFFRYPGVLEMTEAVQAILAGASDSTEVGDQYFVTTPILECGDERYAWVNQAVFVGEGRFLPGPRVQYRVSRVAHG